MFTALQKGVVTAGGMVDTTMTVPKAKVEISDIAGGIAANHTMKDHACQVRL
jgi:hypothetical protein